MIWVWLGLFFFCHVLSLENFGIVLEGSCVHGERVPPSHDEVSLSSDICFSGDIEGDSDRTGTILDEIQSKRYPLKRLVQKLHPHLQRFSPLALLKFTIAFTQRAKSDVKYN